MIHNISILNYHIWLQFLKINKAYQNLGFLFSFKQTLGTSKNALSIWRVGPKQFGDL